MCFFSLYKITHFSFLCFSCFLLFLFLRISKKKMSKKVLNFFKIKKNGQKVKIIILFAHLAHQFFLRIWRTNILYLRIWRTNILYLRIWRTNILYLRIWRTNIFIFFINKIQITTVISYEHT